MKTVSILYFSGYGHTVKQAESVLAGLKQVNNLSANIIKIDDNGDITESDWNTLTESNGIIFGSPTYMGAPAWQFKKFADASSKIWFEQRWKDKVAAGFTNSASMNGDKQATLNYFITLAMQHSMHWIGTGMMPANKKSSERNDVNYLGSFSGLMAQSPSDSSPDEGPLPGDLKTAELFGQRIGEVVAQR